MISYEFFENNSNPLLGFSTIVIELHSRLMMKSWANILLEIEMLFMENNATFLNFMSDLFETNYYNIQVAIKSPSTEIKRS